MRKKFFPAGRAFFPARASRRERLRGGGGGPRAFVVVVDDDSRLLLKRRERRLGGRRLGGRRLRCLAAARCSPRRRVRARPSVLDSRGSLRGKVDRYLRDGFPKPFAPRVSRSFAGQNCPVLAVDVAQKPNLPPRGFRRGFRRGSWGSRDASLVLRLLPRGRRLAHNAARLEGERVRLNLRKVRSELFVKPRRRRVRFFRNF
mmetsp:Transcript_11252/g.47214  ORF Transcript_11252/g.47214 Transcript_11252/m.47214 type:complete len:202 (+) Transcript_11252:3702-4307(+)